MIMLRVGLLLLPLLLGAGANPNGLGRLPPLGWNTWW